MRVLALALCGLLISANLAAAAPADRAALLERLRQALPKLSEIMPVDRMAALETRKDLLAQNPGKEAVVEKIAGEMGACVAKLIEGRDFIGEAVSRADKAGMTEAELLTVIAYYEDPDLKALFRQLGPALESGKDPDIDPATMERLQTAGRDPAVVKFSKLISGSSEDIFEDEAMMDGIMVCAADLAEAVEAAGLAFD
ncbi:MAG TPA: hypothetical protein VEA44_02785 [Caulobacter sp.]|nr:hypothetical protein [Caulobacter sp.]